MASVHDNDDDLHDDSVVGQLNIEERGTPEEVRELNPEQPKEEPKVDTPDGEGAGDHPDDEDDDRRGRVDTELDDAATDEEREQIRARRRQERLDKRQRQRDKTDKLARQLADERSQRLQVEQRLRQLEQANMGTRLADLQRTEAEADQAELTLRTALANATNSGDGATAAEATVRLQQLAVYRQNLRANREQLEQVARRPPQQHIDPQLVANAENFRKKNPWYKGPNAPDPDSRVLSAIDNSLASEGWDPASDAYWEELETRARKYLPDRFSPRAQAGGRPYNSSTAGGAGQGKQPRQSSPVAGSGSSGGSSSSGGERQPTMRLSEARVAAMKASGAWDDPVRKADMIKRYQEQDKRDAANRS